MDLFGIKLLGVNSENLQKLLLTVAFVVTALILRMLLTRLSQLLISGQKNERVRFWIHQGNSLTIAFLLIVGVLSIWFDDPTKLTTAAGLVSAGLAFALQKVVTSVAAYFVILRGRTFNVGDRIMMGGVRGDVIALSFTTTTVMEMGLPPGERPDVPSVWVKSRQYTGRVVTITNDKIFEEPVYNYTREFPYLWEEISIPIRFSDDYRRVEEFLLETARKHTLNLGEVSKDAFENLKNRFYEIKAELEPRVYVRIADSWVELSLRFLARDRGIRELKDKMTREILQWMDEANIGIASTTYEITGMPTIKIEGIQPTNIPE
jgi:small-conductance mechanosensitive channel